MQEFAKFITNHNILILIIGLLLLIPTIYGYINTRINYDILIYLPEKIDTIKGQNILTDDFKIGSYAFVMVDNKSNYDILKLEDKIKKIDTVNEVISIADVTGTTVPIEMLPDKVLDKLYKDDTTVIMVTFKGTTSQDQTVKAVRELRKVAKDPNNVSSMTSMVIDTMDLSNKELAIYVSIAVILCLIVLVVATNSYAVPILLLLNIGLAILYNLGSNIFLGQISYITKAITAILQLGVTTDFSIFLYHKYEQAKKTEKDNRKAMEIAIKETFTSVIGSSLTTFVGFLSLCTMDLTLGTDIGLVMSKGVLFGLITVLTIFPALLLTFDKLIERGKHKEFLPKFNRISNFAIKNYKIIFICFLILLIPAYIGNKSYDVYYKLDDSLPKDLPFHVANSRLAEKFGISSPEIIILDKNIKNDKVNNLVNELKDIEKLVKKYDKKGLLAGEGALMKDLVEIADQLPIILIFAIEFAIFMNMACAYFTGTRLPFISSIVVGTIQLGATIDYAILMSTKYLEERHKLKHDKDKAIKNTLKVTVPSIITSAFCFFAATIGVGLYTKIDMIGSICNLLARGSIISMLVVILILPALLIIFDKFILKTTRFKREVK